MKNISLLLENTSPVFVCHHPSHWQIKRLKWTTSGIYNGIWGDDPDGVNDIVCVRVADFDRTTNRVVDNPPTIRAVSPRFLDNRKLESGDLLIEKSGGGENQLVGCVVSFDHDFNATCSNFVARIKIALNHHSRFLVYLHASLYSARFNFSAIKQTTGIQNLDAEAYFDIKVACPSYEEQRTIASYLDRETAHIDALIAEKERMLALLEEKRAALISQAVTCGLDPDVPLKPSGLDWLGDIPAHWELKPFKYVAWLNPPVDISHIKEGYMVTFLPMDRIKNGYFINNFESFDKYNSSYNWFAEGDIVLAKVTPCFENGNIAIAEGLENKVGFGSSEIFVIRPIGSDVRFIFYYLQSNYFMKLGEASMTGAGGLKRVSPEMVRGHHIGLPPVREQKKIAKYLDIEIGRLKGIETAIRESVFLLKERRSALITAAVTGQIPPEEMAA